MKRVFVCIALVTLSIGAIAQTKAVKIESPIVSEKDFVWYTEQKEAWKAETQKNPTNETAWLNYYNAAHYMSWFQQEDSTAKQVVHEMEQIIPNSYTFNFCAYRESVQGKGYGDHKKYAEAALAKLPDEMQFFDYDNWVCYLAMQGDEVRMKPLAKRYFDSGIYSEAVLRYSFNELAGMDENSIYIANGDAAIIPKWLIQEGMGMHKDKTIICASFLAVKEYRDWLCKKLGVVDLIHEEPYWTDESCNALLQAIIDKFGSKVYFSTTTPSSTMEPWKNNLYNEGLLLKYLKKPYDNLAAAIIGFVLGLWTQANSHSDVPLTALVDTVYIKVPSPQPQQDSVVQVVPATSTHAAKPDPKQKTVRTAASANPTQKEYGRPVADDHIRYDLLVKN